MRTALLAEADRELRDAYVWVLSRHGFQMDTAEDGLACLTKLRRYMPELLILDMELAWGGGDGVLEILRDEPCLLPPQVLLTSAVVSTRVLEGMAWCPAVQALSKPFRLSELQTRVATVWTKHHEPVSPGAERHGILVVDDDSSVRDVLRTWLHLHGFHVWTASNGEEALDHCCAHGEDIAVVLLDLHMPGLDGRHTLKGIREFDAKLPVCLMSADAGDCESSNPRRWGARHVFPKPLHMGEILPILRDLANDRMRELQGN